MNFTKHHPNINPENGEYIYFIKPTEMMHTRMSVNNVISWSEVLQNDPQTSFTLILALKNKSRNSKLVKSDLN